MIPAMLNGKVVFYWQTDKNLPLRGDRITYENHVYEVLYRHYVGVDIQLILKDVTN